MDHKHFWFIMGFAGSRWYKKHALAHCKYCPAWTVLEYGQRPGTCEHSLGSLRAYTEEELRDEIYRRNLRGKGRGGSRRTTTRRGSEATPVTTPPSPSPE